MRSLFKKLLLLRLLQSVARLLIHSDKPNRWKGLVLGAVGGAIGTLAMGYYFQTTSSLMSNEESKQSTEDGGNNSSQEPELISVVGKHYQDDESSTAALGRIVYQTLTGKPPESQTKTAMSQIIHWSFGAANGALYGAVRANAGIPDVAGGAFFGANVWLWASTLMVPLLGLSPSPTTTPTQQHVNYLGGHIVYGITTAAVTQTLYRML